MSQIVARHFETGEWQRVSLEDRRIGSIEGVEPPSTTATTGEIWFGPAFWDIQTNGRWGVSYSDPGLTVEQVAGIVRAQAALGSARVCPTSISAPFEAMRHGVATIAAACEADREVASRVIGIHLEGPAISGLDGYRGAHPLDAVRDPDWDEFQRLQEVAGGRIVLVTLAPERVGAIAFIRRVVDTGVTVALGHTAADGATIRAAADAGATLSTHLGNGIASPLARHPNPIWDQAGIDGLNASFIADGHHMDGATLRVLVRAKTLERVLLVSDASPLAGLPPGTYGPWAVDPSGKIVVAGTPYLAGSNQGLEVGLNTLVEATGVGLGEAFATVGRNPARVLGREIPALRAGQPANLVIYRRDRDRVFPRFVLLRTCVDGVWEKASDDAPAPW
ncbi:MAG: N-acetylglucosamine-6-phosphate deacetylase [Isosphaeraceae bacterium]